MMALRGPTRVYEELALLQVGSGALRVNRQKLRKVIHGLYSHDFNVF